MNPKTPGPVVDKVRQIMMDRARKVSVGSYRDETSGGPVEGPDAISELIICGGRSSTKTLLKFGGHWTPDDAPKAAGIELFHHMDCGKIDL